MSRRDIKDKSEIDMYQMAILINKNVTIMSIFDLKHIADNRISCHTLNEIVSSMLELRRSSNVNSNIHTLLISEFVLEVFVEIIIIRLTHLISRDGVRNNFNYSSNIAILIFKA